jgi:hypothetical protein
MKLLSIEKSYNNLITFIDSINKCRYLVATVEKDSIANIFTNIFIKLYVQLYRHPDPIISI